MKITHEEIKKVAQEFKAMNGNVNIPTKDIVLITLKTVLDMKDKYVTKDTFYWTIGIIVTVFGIIITVVKIA